MKLFSEICMKCLNLQVRFNKMVNKHTVSYHPSPSELTSRIHSLIFQWTPKGFIFSPECFLNFLKPVFCTMVAENFQIHVVKITEKCMCESKSWICVSQKVEYLSKNLPLVLIITPCLSGRKLTISTKQRFLYFSSRERGRIMELKKWQKINM